MRAGEQVGFAFVGGILMKPSLAVWLAIAVVLIPGARAQDDSVVCGGSDRWPIKTTADTSQSVFDAAAASPPKSVDDLLSEPRPRWTAPKSSYQKKAIPGDEGIVVRVRGWLYRIGHDPNDSDYHLQLVTDPKHCTNKSVIVEVPDDRCVVAANLVPFERTARNELDVMLGHQPTLNGGESPPKPIEVIVTGRLFYDLHHEKKNGSPALRGHGACKAGTLWEVHPVFAVEIPATAVNTAKVSVTDSQKKRRRALRSTHIRPTRHRSKTGTNG
jgi:hypothetical protein